MKTIVFICVFMIECFVTYGQDTTEMVTDIDGNVYRTIKIGAQTWMAEDLKVTTYRNGAPIDYIPGEELGKRSWEKALSGAYCWYNNNESSGKTYGALYNWEAVNSGVLAPKGWHVPSLEEWKVLIEFLGGEKNAGGKLKEVGTDHWTTPNGGADNSSGFTALPGGGRQETFDFLAIGYKAWWWTSTKKNLLKSYYIQVNYKLPTVNIYTIENFSGLSVRCIKDE